MYAMVVSIELKEAKRKVVQAKALQGLMADHTRDNYPREFAEYAYELADAMIAARLKETNK
jgi:hypothetical protein